MRVSSIATSLPRKVSSVEPFYSSTISAETITLKQNWIDSQSCEISFLGLKANPWNKSVPELEIYPKTVSVSYLEADSKFILSNIETFQGVKILFQFSGIEKEFIIQPPINNFDLFFRKRNLLAKLRGVSVQNYYYIIIAQSFGEVYNSQGTLFSSNASYFDDKFINYLFDELTESIELEVSVLSRSDDSLFSKFPHTLDPPGLGFFDLDIKSELIFDETNGYIAKLEIKNFPPSINNLIGTLEYLDKNNIRMSEDVNLQNPENQNIVSTKLPVSFDSVYDELNKFKLVLDDSKHYDLELINPNSLSISVEENVNHLDSYSNIIEIDSEGEWIGELEFSLTSNYLDSNNNNLDYTSKSKISNSFSMSLVDLREKLPIIDRIFEISEHSEIVMQIRLYPFNLDKDYTEFSTTINRFEHPTVKLIRNHDLAEFQNEFIFLENDGLNILAFKYCVPYFSDPNFILRIGGREIKAIETNIEKDYFREIHFDISEIKYEDLFKNNRWFLMSNSGDKNILKGKIILNKVGLNMPMIVKIFQRDDNFIFPEVWQFNYTWETNLEYSLTLFASDEEESKNILLDSGKLNSSKVSLEDLVNKNKLSSDFLISNNCKLELYIQSRGKRESSLNVEKSDDLLIFLVDWIREVWDGSISVIKNHNYKDEIVIIMKNYFSLLSINQKNLFHERNKRSNSYDIFKQIKRIFASVFDLPKLAAKMFPEGTTGSDGLSRAIDFHSFIEEEWLSPSNNGNQRKHHYLIDTLHQDHIKLLDLLDQIDYFVSSVVNFSKDRYIRKYIQNQCNDKLKYFFSFKEKILSQSNEFVINSVIPNNAYYEDLKIIYQDLNQFHPNFKNFHRRSGINTRFSHEREELVKVLELHFSYLENKFNIDNENKFNIDNVELPRNAYVVATNRRTGKKRIFPNIFTPEGAAEVNRRKAERDNIKRKRKEMNATTTTSSVMQNPHIGISLAERQKQAAMKLINEVDKSKDIEKLDPEVKAKILDLTEKRDNAQRNKLDKKAKSFQKKIDNWKNPTWVARKNRKNSVNKLKRNSRNKIQGKGDEK